MRRFQIATEEEIKNAETTDIYFTRTKEILEKEGRGDLRVTAEITTQRSTKKLGLWNTSRR